MSDKAKFILKIFGFIAIVLLFAWAIWALFFRSSNQRLIPGIAIFEEKSGLPEIKEGPSGTIVDTPQTQLPVLPEEYASEEEVSIIAAGGRTKADVLIDDRAEYATLSSSGRFNYYDWRDEKFYALTPGGAPVPLSDEIFRSVEDVYWSNNGNSAVLEFPDGSNIYYDFNSGKRATLPKEAQEFSFSPDDGLLSYEYIGQTKDDRWIVVSSPDGQGQTLVQEIGDESRNVKVDWSPNNQVVATFRDMTSSIGEEVFFIGFNNENFLSLQTNGVGFLGEWSPKGKQILYSVFSKDTNYNPSLHIAGAEGDNIGLGNRSLNIQTWPDKCVFESEEIVYCAVPRSLEAGSGIFRERAYSVRDSIYKIDLINNISSVIAYPETDSQTSFTIDNLMISEDKGELYFIDRVYGRIHRIRLR